jgi:hypothetical protein
MADLISHALSAVLVRGRRTPDPVLLWLVTGTILPDLLSRAPFVALRLIQSLGFMPKYSLQETWIPLGFNFPHTPAGIGLVALLCAMVVPRWLISPLPRLQFALWLSLGGLLHLAIDLLQEHLQPGYFLFYPLSVRAFELGLVRSDGSVLFLPVLIGLTGLLMIPWLRRKRE